MSEVGFPTTTLREEDSHTREYHVLPEESGKEDTAGDGS